MKRLTIILTTINHIKKIQRKVNQEEKSLNKYSKEDKKLDFEEKVEKVKYINLNNERCSRSLNKTNFNIDKNMLSASES